MPDNPQEVHKEIEGVVKAEVAKLEKGRFGYDLDRAKELGKDLENMNRALVEAQAAVDSLQLKKPEDARRAKEAFENEISEALVALRDSLRGHETDAALLITITRQGLENLGELAKKGPETYPKPKWEFLGPSQIDEWLEEVNRGDPRNALKAIIGATRETVDEIATAVPTEEAKREGVIEEVNHEKFLLTKYLTGGPWERK